ncbi:sensor histidine kinase [Rhodococcoides corynebacterioides]|uniref:sensor histidine kinase n=1 Tax=Rhodococcoides corynebacterioides TaxID=53972 RepID=UPI001C9B360B|nr:HAMP domain-containing sensor histidine kinase [Rhodococcus corynebacterioides]MBY6350948.1 HAMP domain-containing histidine kinase [Rhodococcus corynebacterioides]
MRVRLLLVMGLLIGFGLIALGVPLALVQAENYTRDFANDRSRDVAYIAELAESAIIDGDASSVQEYIARYAEVFDRSPVVVNALEVPRAGPALDEAEARAVGAVLRGETVSAPRALWPWSADTVVFAQVVGLQSSAGGAVVLSPPTDDVRRAVLQAWLWVAGIVTIAAVALTVAIDRVATWVLAPVAQLSADASTLATTLTTTAATVPTQVVDGPAELQQLRASFDRLATRVRESTRAQQKLMADTAHQLRNPLTALQLRLDTLELELPEGPGVDQVRSAGDEVERLSRLLADMLVLAHIESDAGSSTAGVGCVVAAVFGDREAAWRSTFELAGMTLDVRDAADCPDVAIRADDLAQILDVALSNSSRYAGAGATTVVSAQRGAGDVVEITVADDGVGVRAAEVDELMTRFVTSSEDGSGLGLPIALTLATKANGTLDLTPGSPRGAVVTLVLPISHCSVSTGSATEP